MLAAIMLTTDTNEYFGFVNVTVNAIHCIVAFFYMISRGHYFKHSKKGNVVTRAIEMNNYWNIFSILWASNYLVVPLIKLSYRLSHDIPVTETTPFAIVADGLGMLVCAAYTVAVWY